MNHYFERILILKLFQQGKQKEFEAKYPKDVKKRAKEYFGELYNEPGLKINTEVRANSYLYRKL